VEPGEAVVVAQLFDWYLDLQATAYRLAKRLTDFGWRPRRASRAGTRHRAQPGLYRSGADQPHPGGASPPTQVGAAAGRAW
jgi:hypothetical protein